MEFLCDRMRFRLGFCLVAKLVRLTPKQALGVRMLKLSSSKGMRIDVPVLSVSWSVEDHSVIIQALRKGLIEREASGTGGVPRWKSSCPDRLAEATRSNSECFRANFFCFPLFSRRPGMFSNNERSMCSHEQGMFRCPFLPEKSTRLEKIRG